MTLSKNFISITDMRQNATNCIKDLSTSWDKIIFKNNKPTAVLVDFQRYEKMFRRDSSVNIESLFWSEEVLWTSEHEELISIMRSA